MSIAVKQQHLIERYQVLPSPQERLNALVDKSAKVPPLSEAEKVETNRVHGCQSKVFVVGHIEEGLCRFRADADSVLVRGLVILLVSLYDGAPAAEVIQTEPEILTRLGIWQILSPTRQNGLTHVRLFIKELAGRF